MPFLVLWLAVAAVAVAPQSSPRSWQPVVIAGADLPDLLGSRTDRIGVLRCAGDACEPIPFQVDERDPAGEWVLDSGAAPSSDESPGALDANDELLFMADDAGAAAASAARRAGAVLDVRLDDPFGYPSRHVYLAASESGSPASPRRYVAYDAAEDRLTGTVTLGFRDGVPSYLALPPAGANLLDRLKIRATATFLWGLFGVTRSEQDLLPEAPSWKAGPVRVIRRQPMQIRMRFGLRSPRFVSTTYFYRDFAELPLRIRLRVPPRYFFTSITVDGGLDFRGLPGEWRAVLPGGETLSANCLDGVEIRRDDVPGDWLALEAQREPMPGFTVVQRLHRSPSLESVQQTAWYRCGAIDDPPENAPGQCPALGFTLADWDGVEGGEHTLTSTSWAVPAGVDLDVFLATIASPLAVTITSLVEPAEGAGGPQPAALERPR